MSANHAVVVAPEAPGRLVLRPWRAELGSEPASVGLWRLADLVATERLVPHISVERPWTEIAQVAQDLVARRFNGKAVLMVG